MQVKVKSGVSLVSTRSRVLKVFSTFDVVDSDDEFHWYRPAVGY